MKTLTIFLLSFRIAFAQEQTFDPTSSSSPSLEYLLRRGKAPSGNPTAPSARAQIFKSKDGRFQLSFEDSLKKPLESSMWQSTATMWDLKTGRPVFMWSAEVYGSP